VCEALIDYHAIVSIISTPSLSLWKSPDVKTICLHSVSINLLVADRYTGYVTGDKVRDRQDMIYTLLCLCLLILELGFCSWSEQMDASEKERLDDPRRRKGSSSAVVKQTTRQRYLLLMCSHFCRSKCLLLIKSKQ
jgi:hypothetical protein